MSFGKVLEKIRKEKKDSFRKLAGKINFSYTYIQQIEKEVRPASEDFLEKIIEIYPDKRYELELAYCEDKLPVSIFNEIKTNQKIDSLIEKIASENSLEKLYNIFFKELDIEGQKEIMNLIINRLEKLSDEGKYKKDKEKINMMKKLIKEF